MKAGESVTEVEVLKFNALARSLGVSVDVCGVDLICPDNHIRLYGLEMLTVYIVINGNGVVSIELNLDNNVKPATPTVLTVNCYGTNCVSVIAVESYLAVSYGSKVDKTYGGFRPTVVAGATPIAGTTVSIDLELSTSRVCVLHIDSEGHESGSCVSVGEACKLSGLSLTGNPDFVLNVCTVVSEFESTVFISLGVVCILSNAEVVSVVHTTVKYVVVSTGRTCVSNLVAVNSNCKVVVSSSLSVYCATVKAVRDTCCLAEVVLAYTADPAARTGDVLGAVLGSVKHVKLTVESVVIGVTEGNVIKCEAGVSNVSPTVDVEASYVKVLTGRRNYVLVLGCGSLKLAVDVVSDSDLTIIGKGDMKLYGEPLGPAVTCSRDGSESSVAVETSSKGNTVFRVCADVKHVVVKRPLTIIIPVSVSSFLTDSKVVRGGHAGSHTEGDNTEGVVLTGEAVKTCVSAVVRKPSHKLRTGLTAVGCGSISAVPSHFVCAISLVKLSTTVGCEVEVRGNVSFEVNAGVFTGNTTAIVSTGVNYGLAGCIISGSAHVVRCNGNGTGPATSTRSVGVTGCRSEGVLSAVKSPVRIYGVTECEVIHVVTGTLNPSVKVYVYAGNLICGRSEVLFTACNVLAVDVVESGNSILLSVYGECDLNIHPIGPAGMVDSKEGSCACAVGIRVPTADVVTKNSVATGHSSNLEDVGVDTACSAPSVVYKLEGKSIRLVSEVNIELEGENTGRTVLTGEKVEVLTVRCLVLSPGEPHLKLALGVNGSILIGDSLEVLAVRYVLVSAVVVLGSTANVSAVKNGSVRAVVVDTLRLDSEGHIAAFTTVSELTVNKAVIESVVGSGSYGLATGSTYGSGGTSSSGCIVTGSVYEVEVLNVAAKLTGVSIVTLSLTGRSSGSNLFTVLMSASVEDPGCLVCITNRKVVERVTGVDVNRGTVELNSGDHVVFKSVLYAVRANVLTVKVVVSGDLIISENEADLDVEPAGRSECGEGAAFLEVVSADLVTEAVYYSVCRLAVFLLSVDVERSGHDLAKRRLIPGLAGRGHTVNKVQGKVAAHSEVDIEGYECDSAVRLGEVLETGVSRVVVCRDPHGSLTGSLSAVNGTVVHGVTKELVVEVTVCAFLLHRSVGSTCVGRVGLTIIEGEAVEA